MIGSDVGQKVLIILLFAVFLFPHSVSLAQVTTGSNSVSIHVSNEGNSSAFVESHTNTSQSTTTTSNSHAEVTVEQNGEVVRFESEGEDIHYVSDDGNVVVNVDSDTSQLTQGEVNEATSEAQIKKITWIEKDETTEDIGGDNTETKDDFQASTLLKPVDIVMSVITTIPSPVTQVDRLVSLIKSAVSFF